MFYNTNFLCNTIITKPAIKAISAFSTGLDIGGAEVNDSPLEKGSNPYLPDSIGTLSCLDIQSKVLL